MLKSPIRELFKNINKYKKTNDGDASEYLIVEGDYGGQIYLTCPKSLIKLSNGELKNFINELDKKYWNDSEGLSMTFEKHKVNDTIPGGMGGGIIKNTLWVHPDIVESKDFIEESLLS